MKLPKSFTKVTPFSKYLALAMLVIIPILTFFYGQYYERVTQNVQSQTQKQTLVSISSHGGLCQTGECISETFIYKDGSIVQDGKTVKQLPTEQIQQLENRFATTNFAHVKDFKFTETCPTAYDGQELIYTFYLPEKQETFASCEYDLSESDIFAFVDELVSFTNTQIDTPTPTTNPEGQTCGFYTPKCPTGYSCSIPNGENGGINPQGTCIKEKQTRKPAKEGEFCGGVAGFQCADGYRCKFTCLNGSTCDDNQYPYPDAGGVCVKN